MVYVCSDIHGRWDRYEKALKKIKKSDKLYILGDVIDRHENGIAILCDIINRPNVELLLGNHEDMMIKAYSDNKEEAEYWTEIWTYTNNGGGVTRKAFERLSKNNQTMILEYLRNLKVIQRITASGQGYYLCHGGAVEGYEDRKYVRRTEVSKRELEGLVWGSPFRPDRNSPDWGIFKKHSDTIHIFGHVMVQRISGENEVVVWENIMAIDGGCAKRGESANDGNLILVNLNTQSITYIK
jgi:serine/threonine protein phosphatase 1